MLVITKANEKLLKEMEEIEKAVDGIFDYTKNLRDKGFIVSSVFDDLLNEKIHLWHSYPEMLKEHRREIRNGK
jgi:hypothetical protein